MRNLSTDFPKKTGFPVSIDYHYKFLVLLPLESDEKIEALKHYFGITYEDDLVVRGIEIRQPCYERLAYKTKDRSR